MKIGLVSDIHCNVAGLERALDLMGDVDALICAGDAIYQYRFSNDVVRILRDRGAHVIQGNHEATFFSYQGERARADPKIDAGLLAWLAAQPLELHLRFGGARVAVVHGSPWEPRYEYLYPHSPALARFRDYPAEFVILGHTHHQMLKRVGGTLLINPGSAGEPRDARNSFQLSCAVLDLEEGAVTFHDYPDPTRVLAPSSGGLAPSTAPAADPRTERPTDGPDPWQRTLGI